MKTTRISCTIAQTINTGNYSSFRVEWTEERDVTNVEEAAINLERGRLLETVRLNLKDAIQQGPVR